MRWFRRPERGILLPSDRRRAGRRPGGWRWIRLALLGAAALMVATAAISYSNNKLRRRKTYMTIAELTDAVHRFHHDFQRYPDSFDRLLEPPAGQPPYLERVPDDAWGNPFRYRVEIEGGRERFVLVSDGPDAEPGTRDDIENL